MMAEDDDSAIIYSEEYSVIERAIAAERVDGQDFITDDGPCKVTSYMCSSPLIIMANKVSTHLDGSIMIV